MVLYWTVRYPHPMPWISGELGDQGLVRGMASAGREGACHCPQFHTLIPARTPYAALVLRHRSSRGTRPDHRFPRYAINFEDAYHHHSVSFPCLRLASPTAVVSAYLGLGRFQNIHVQNIHASELACLADRT